ncbi:MAG: hypothetical protein K0R38_7050 [Polyangiaceae bacterium]|jgi:hypothetical protein|nr:hypothetical protein [Polyangiaceae bacterium]
MDDEQYLIDQGIGKATLECLDPAWDAAELVVELGGDTAGLQLRRLGTHEVVAPSDELQLAVGHLLQHHTDTESELQRITYTFRRKPDGKWKFEADFVYPED